MLTAYIILSLVIATATSGYEHVQRYRHPLTRLGTGVEDVIAEFAATAALWPLLVFCSALDRVCRALATRLERRAERKRRARL